MIAISSIVLYAIYPVFYELYFDHAILEMWIEYLGTAVVGFPLRKLFEVVVQTIGDMESVHDSFYKHHPIFLDIQSTTQAFVALECLNLWR
jgi:predicted membrane protein